MNNPGLALLAVAGGLPVALGDDPARPRPSLRAVVEVEETVTTYSPANNGAGPLWCYGSPLVVRSGDDVFVSTIETGEGVPPLCNTRWQLWRKRGDRGAWTLVRRERDHRQREPCPLAVLGDGRVFLSVNPSTEPPGTQYGPCAPRVAVLDRASLDAAAVDAATRLEEPAWSPGTRFTDHSYRGFAADASRGELLLLNINASTSAQFVSHRDATGTWHARGTIEFPIRAAYPQVVLTAGGAHVLAIGDIVEPVEAWRALKREVTGNSWDYVFRRLFYAWTPSIAAAPFAAPIEIASVERTGGHILNLDLHVDGEGTAHALFIRRPHQHAFLRDRYFPGEPMTAHLEHVTLKDGAVVGRRTLAGTPTPGKSGIEPSYARFCVSRDGDLLVVLSGAEVDSAGARRAGNFLAALGADAERPPSFAPLDLERPFGTFFTSVPRGGAAPSDTIDLFGSAGGRELRYARLRLRAGPDAGD